MARVNIEEYAFGERRLQRLGQMLSWSQREALGCLAYLWHDSQEKLRTHGTADEIVEWCWAVSPEEGQRILLALETCGYISRADDDPSSFLIHGNEAQIEHRVANMARSAKGGAATKAKWDAVKAKQGFKLAAKPSPGPSVEPSPAPKMGAAMPSQCNAMQGNAEQCKAMQGKVTLSPVKSPPTESDLAVGSEWLQLALDEMPWQVGKRGYTPEAFAEGVGKLKRATDLNDDGVAALLAFIRSDDFWRKNALSPVGLLKKSDRNGQRKVDNILVRMRSRGDRRADELKAWAAESGDFDPAKEIS